MSKSAHEAFPVRTPALEPAMLQTEPEPLEIDLKRTAVVVVDMQNAFVSNGGMFDLWGVNVSRNQKIIEPIKRLINAAQTRGLKVIHIAHQYSPDLHDSGGPNSPNWYQRMLKSYRERPEWRDKLLFRGTWGADTIEELKPREGDIFVIKPKYSAFFSTNLDIILKTYDIKYLLFTGVATNICVEASIRDAYYLDYFPTLVSDAAMNLGPPSTQEATIFNVQACYGWVTTTKNIVKAMEQPVKVAARLT